MLKLRDVLGLFPDKFRPFKEVTGRHMGTWERLTDLAGKAFRNRNRISVVQLQASCPNGFRMVMTHRLLANEHVHHGGEGGKSL